MVRIDWRNNPFGSNPRGLVIDLDTGKPVGHVDGHGGCCMVDEETGEWERYVKRDGRHVIGPDHRVLIEKGRGRVKFYPKGTPEYAEAMRVYINREPDADAPVIVEEKH